MTTIRQDKISTGRENLAALKQKIIGYAIANRRLPLATDSMFQVKDAWGNLYKYVPSSGLTGATVNLCMFSSCPSPLSVTTTTGTVSDVAFVLASLGPNGKSDGNYTQPASNLSKVGDDLADYMTFSQLYRIVCQPLSFDSNSTSGIITLGPGPGGSGPGGPGPSGFNAVPTAGAAAPLGVSRNSDGSLLLGFSDAQQANASTSGTYTYGCTWYQGSTYPCILGNCTFSHGLRAYFTFTMAKPAGYAGQLADGFTFAVASAETNSNKSCGGRGSAMGYASGYLNQGSDAGNAPFLVSPKIGVEFDPYICYGDNGLNNGCGGGCGTNNQHVAIVYWGFNNPNFVGGNSVGSNAGDDNTHGAGSTGVTSEPMNPTCNTVTQANNHGFWNSGSATWFDTNAGVTRIPVRVEINRTSSLAASKGNFTTTVWFNCQNCNDVTTSTGSYTATAKLTNSTQLDAATTANLRHVQFGFTEGTGASHQQVTVRDLAVKFY